MEHDATVVNHTPQAQVGGDHRSKAQAAQKSEAQVGGDHQSKAQAAQKSDEKKAPELKQSDAKKLIQFMESNYEQRVAVVKSFDEFYHAIFELIEMFCEERGQLQYRLPEKEKLLQAYTKHHTSVGAVKKDEFGKIAKEVIRPGSFAIGKATTDVLMVLFGAPLCALVAKRILPGLGWLSDDVVIPLATSGSVAYLVHSKKL